LDYSGVVELKDATSTYTPQSGYGKLYAKTDSLYFKNDGGTEFNLTETGSGGTDDQTLSIDSTTIGTGQRVFDITIEDGNTVSFIDSTGYWAFDGNDISYDNDVAIGKVSDNSARLMVEGNGTGIEIESTSATGNYRGISATVAANTGTAGYFHSSANSGVIYGVYAIANNSSNGVGIIQVMELGCMQTEIQ